LTKWFKIAHAVQLFAMTYVASEKGWDGMSLLILLIFSTLFQLRFLNSISAKMFCENNGLTIQLESFEFSGRTPMLGAIQKLSGSHTWDWMDEILAPSPRREAWARSLSRGDTDTTVLLLEEMKDFAAFDQRWALMNKSLADRGAALMSRAVQGLSTELV